MPKVFIIEHPRNNVDISDAQKFGDIVCIFERDDRRCGVFHHAEFGRTILRRLEELGFDPDVDFICVVGAMLTVVTAIIAVSQYYDKFNALLFNSVNGSYVEKQFNENDWKGLRDGKEDKTTTRLNQRV